MPYRNIVTWVSLVSFIIVGAIASAPPVAAQWAQNFAQAASSPEARLVVAQAKKTKTKKKTKSENTIPPDRRGS